MDGQFQGAPFSFSFMFRDVHILTLSFILWFHHKMVPVCLCHRRTRKKKKLTGCKYLYWRLVIDLVNSKHTYSSFCVKFQDVHSSNL